jgi:phage replication initiation protein
LRGQFAGVAGGAHSGTSAVSCSQAGNWIAPDGTGRTLYIGKAKNGKMLRVYEKGRQLGCPTSEWVRWEVQFTNRDRVIPIESLTSPAEFARGAYAALAFIGGPECRIKTRRVADRISLAKLTEHAKESYGTLFNVLSKSGLTALELVERVEREGIPRRLNAPTDFEIMDRCNALVASALESFEVSSAVRH